MKKRVFYVEDEAFLAKIVKDTLESKGYEVMHNRNGTKVFESLSSFNPDICLLDVMLPVVDGFTIGNHIRNTHPHLPIIFLTAKTQPDDVIKGFSSGGTDYLKKPFSMEELIVRMENQLKLSKANTPDVDALPDEIALKDYKFYPGKFELHTGEEVIKLSNREAQILKMLCSHKNKPIDRKILLQMVWGDDSFFNSRNLDVYIRKLRGYFEAGKGIEIITLKGIGYHFSVS
ncbi:MAG TPA: response regulator transcription factor [Flavipsychrobacter sp.]|nr:response regulator transcription factor [Flavipsychrobacter sp.]